MPRKPASGNKVISIDSGGYRARFLQKRDKLADEHFFLVRPIAERLHARLPPSFELEDLIQVGFVGLVSAATRYRPTEHNDTPFSAFARKYIRGFILDSIRRRNYTENTRPGLEETTEQVDQGPTVECIIDRKRLIKRVDLSRQALNDEQAAVVAAYYSPKMPSLATVAAEMGLPEWRVVRAHSEAIAILKRELKVA